MEQIETAKKVRKKASDYVAAIEARLEKAKAKLLEKEEPLHESNAKYQQACEELDQAQKAEALDEALKAQKMVSEKRSSEVHKDESAPTKRAKTAETMHPKKQTAWNCFKDAFSAGVETGIESANIEDLQMLTKRLLEALASAQEKQREERLSEASDEADEKMPDAAAAPNKIGSANLGKGQGRSNRVHCKQHESHSN